MQVRGLDRPGARVVNPAADRGPGTINGGGFYHLADRRGRNRRHSRHDDRGRRSGGRRGIARRDRRGVPCRVWPRGGAGKGRLYLPQVDVLAGVDGKGVNNVIHLGHLAIVQPIAKGDGIQGIAALHHIHRHHRLRGRVGGMAAAAAAGEAIQQQNTRYPQQQFVERPHRTGSAALYRH